MRTLAVSSQSIERPFGREGGMADQTPGRIFRQGLFTENPIVRHVLGICSTLAVTNLVVN
ncbi:MAG: Rnf-Nqr domain containing protein, partial [Thermodesulfobacteriota bacterium]